MTARLHVAGGKDSGPVGYFCSPRLLNSVKTGDKSGKLKLYCARNKTGLRCFKYHAICGLLELKRDLVPNRKTE